MTETPPKLSDRDLALQILASQIEPSDEAAGREFERNLKAKRDKAQKLYADRFVEIDPTDRSLKEKLGDGLDEFYTKLGYFSTDRTQKIAEYILSPEDKANLNLGLKETFYAGTDRADALARLFKENHVCNFSSTTQELSPYNAFPSRLKLPGGEISIEPMEAVFDSIIADTHPYFRPNLISAVESSDSIMEFEKFAEPIVEVKKVPVKKIVAPEVDRLAGLPPLGKPTGFFRAYNGRMVPASAAAMVADWSNKQHIGTRGDSGIFVTASGKPAAATAQNILHAALRGEGWLGGVSPDSVERAKKRAPLPSMPFISMAKKILNRALNGKTPLQAVSPDSAERARIKAPQRDI